MIAVLKDIDTFCFLSAATEIRLTTTKEKLHFVLSKNDAILLDEYYTPIEAGIVEILNLNELIEPFLRAELRANFTYTASDGEVNIKRDFTIQYCTAEVWMSCAEFLSKYYLTKLQGAKQTNFGRKEVLHLITSEQITVTATCDYALGGTIISKTTTLAVLEAGTTIQTIDVSPDKFNASGGLVSYTIQAGKRSQRFVIKQSEAAPALTFINSFGCEETFYCTGTLTLAPEFTRLAAYKKGLFKNYDIKENRIFKANTGVMPVELADYCDDMLRSRETYLLVDTGNKREITITDSKSERTNDDDALFSFTFDYRLSQRNHNVLELPRAGRIFDFTFDKTFA